MMTTISVCIGSACHIKGSHKILTTLRREIENHNLEEKIELNAVFCTGHCKEAVAVKVNEDTIYSVSPETAVRFFEEKVIPLV